MRKHLILIILLLGLSFIQASSRLKLGFNDYSNKIDDFSFKNGIYRVHTRFDLMKVRSNLGIGTNLNLSFKSDNPSLDYYNYYDFYLHNFHGSASDEGYMIYGIYAGMRFNKLKTEAEGFHGKAVFSFTRFVTGIMLTKHYWGFELTATYDESNKFVWTASTKYHLRKKYYLEIAYESKPPYKELDNAVSVTLGLELFRQ